MDSTTKSKKDKSKLKFSKNDDSVSKLQNCLARPGEIGTWLVGNSTDAFEIFANKKIADFFNFNFDGRSVRRRFFAYNNFIERDRDRVRLHGKYYNNIYLGKRIFGPARKQVFNHTIVGGMERRFEIIDNQINHIQFTHEFSDKFVQKCRNSRIKCRDDTRVVLHYPEGLDFDNFIHANYIRSSALFNDFIITQSPMDNTIGDFWRMVWQEEARYIFMLTSRKDKGRCAQYWPKKVGSHFQFFCLRIINEGIESASRDPFFRITRILLCGPNNKEIRIEHWQADMNNSENLETPLRLLRLARCCTRPTIIHDYLGISRASCIIAAELCISQLIRGPLYKHPVQRSIHYLRSMRPFSIETPMQYIFVHRVVQHFITPLAGVPSGFKEDYARWLDERSQRLFLDDFNRSIPAFRLISPKMDPDLLPMVRRIERPECRREMNAHVGELPLSVEHFEIDIALNDNENIRPQQKLNNASNINASSKIMLTNLHLPKRYPRGCRY